MAEERAVIGLTGRTGSGKDLVAEYLRRSFGFGVIDLDRLGHQVVDELAPTLVKVFGEAVRHPSSKPDSPGIDRSALARIVFANPKDLLRLESLVHPVMLERVDQILARDQSPACLLNAAILERLGLRSRCSLVIYLEAPEELLIKRVIARDRLSESEARLRLARQEDVNRTRESADIILVNDASPEDLKSRLRRFVQHRLGSKIDGYASISERDQARTQEGPLYP